MKNNPLILFYLLAKIDYYCLLTGVIHRTILPGSAQKYKD
jgi:hypothetical protein